VSVARTPPKKSSSKSAVTEPEVRGKQGKKEGNHGMSRFDSASGAVMLVVCMWKVANCMRFDIESGHSKCITEDIKISAMTVGKYSLVNPNEGYPMPDDYKLTVKVHESYPSLDFSHFLRTSRNYSSLEMTGDNMEVHSSWLLSVCQ